MTRESMARVLLFLNEHKDELLELGAHLQFDQDRQTNRFDRRVLSERFLMALIPAWSDRLPGAPVKDFDSLVFTARMLAARFLAADQESAPINVADPAPAHS